jgi:hypothetical protein
MQEAERVPRPQAARRRRQAKYKNLTQDVTDTGSCSLREFGAVCVPPKAVKWEQNTSVKNAT